MTRVSVGSASGPLPSIRPQPPRLSRPRAAVLDAVAVAGEPVTLVELGRTSGLHENTLREHLSGLVRAGLVRRDQGQTSGRGRPAWRYRLVGPASPGREYAGLAATLAAVIHRTSARPVEDAVVAGQEWGRDLARSKRPPAADGSPADAHDTVVDLFGDMGFAPVLDADGRVVRLMRCPLLETARRYPEVVCGVHLGVARGALAEHGGDSSRTALRAFAEPGACLLTWDEGSATPADSA